MASDSLSRPKLPDKSWDGRGRQASRVNGQAGRMLKLANYMLIVSECALMSVATHQLWAVAIGVGLCLLHWLLTRRRRRVLRTELLSFLALVGVTGVVLGFQHSLAAGVVSIACFFITVQVMMLFRPFNRREQRLVQVAALFELVAVSIMTSDFAFLFAFVLWVGAFCFHLIAYELNALAAEVPVPEKDEDAPQRRVPGLRYFLRAVIFVSHVLLILTVVLFLLLPRFKSGILMSPVNLSSVTEIGFSDNVAIGDVGKLLESREVVMRVRVANMRPRQFQRVMPRLLMRGRVFEGYKDGKWYAYTNLPGMHYNSQKKSPPESKEGGWFYPRREPGEMAYGNRRGKHWQEVEYEVYLEPLDSKALFALYLPRRVWMPRGTDWSWDQHNAELEVNQGRATRLKYRVTSRVLVLDRKKPPPCVKAALGIKPLHLVVPRELEPTLETKLAEVRDLYEPKTDWEMAAAIERYLKSSREYAYSLDKRSMGRGDPIVGFLETVKIGHCEYFASAMVLLCRQAGLPARLVIGFKGGDFDPKTKLHVMRQKHAHAWVEVQFYTTPDRREWEWVPFDPTSSLAPPHDETGAGQRRARGGFGRGNWLGDFVQSKWLTNVVGYDQEQQRQFLVDAVHTIRYLLGISRAFVRRLVPEKPSVYRLLVPGFVLLVAALGLICYWGIGWLERRLLLRRPVRYHQRATLKFYNQVLKILGRKGLQREPHWTPLEYYREVEKAVQAGGEDVVPVKKGLSFATHLYYDVRYGGRPITQEEMTETRRVLKLLSRWKPRREFKLRKPVAPWSFRSGVRRAASSQRDTS